MWLWGRGVSASLGSLALSSFLLFLFSAAVFSTADKWTKRERERHGETGRDGQPKKKQGKQSENSV